MRLTLRHRMKNMMRRTALIFFLASAEALESLYERLGLTSSASAREIKKAWYKNALNLHPDKVEGTPEVKAAAELRFKAVAEAYEVLSDAALKRQYDSTGHVPDDKAKAAASNRKSTTEDPDEQYGFESAGQQQQQQHQQWQRYGFGWGRFDAFEVGLAQQRARRVRSLGQLRRLLQPHGTGANALQRPRYGLVGFYRRGDEASLKEGLRFPYPFAGWSLGAQGDGFWWEDALQTALVSVGDLASNEGRALLEHFGVAGDDGGGGGGGGVRLALPAVAWVRTDEAMSFEMAPPHVRDAESFVGWVYGHLGASLRVVNNDHRKGVVWWLDGNHAKQQGEVAPFGGTFERASFISHRWYVWPEGTEGNILSHEAALGEITLSRLGETHELVLEPKCLDANGHCGQWKHLGECERNPGFMRAGCKRSCGSCDSWDWLYPLGLATLHERLECWVDPACAATKGYPAYPQPPAGGAPSSSSSSSSSSAAAAAAATPMDIHELRRLARHPARVSWLMRELDERTRAALEQALRPPPAPPPPSPPPVVPPPPIRDEL